MAKYFINTKDGKWRLIKEGGKRATMTADTKEEIMGTMRKFIKGKDAMVYVQKADGQFQVVRDFGK